MCTKKHSWHVVLKWVVGARPFYPMYDVKIRGQSFVHRVAMYFHLTYLTKWADKHSIKGCSSNPLSHTSILLQRAKWGLY